MKMNKKKRKTGGNVVKIKLQTRFKKKNAVIISIEFIDHFFPPEDNILNFNHSSLISKATVGCVHTLIHISIDDI